METLIYGFFFFVYFGLLALEHFFPARNYPKVRFWHLRGVIFFAFYVFFAGKLAMFWDGWLGEHRLIDATALGTWGGALAGLLFLELGIYLWHRTMHATGGLWRWFHQMHHSAERIDVSSAFYFSPLDTAGFTLVGSLSLVLVLGITGEAALIANLTAFFLAVFQHSNLKTPAWLGYFVQRPESHALHHARAVHNYNFSDLPVWDLIFGTFRNPAVFDGEVGFYQGASNRIPEMLLGQLVDQPMAPVLATADDRRA